MDNYYADATASASTLPTMLVTGVRGFIGSNFVRKLHSENYSYKIVGVDSETYAGVNAISRFVDVYHKVSISDFDAMKSVFSRHKPDIIVNFAAESHVDNSIESSAPFVDSNVAGVRVLLDLARENGIKKFVQVSTDEVYGSVDSPARTNSLLNPGNPYAATKAAADLLVLAYENTYNISAVITRCVNNFGPYQHPEKLIPTIIRHLLLDMPVPIYGDGKNIREWIYVDDHCESIIQAMNSIQNPKTKIANIGGAVRLTNLEMVSYIAKCLGKETYTVRFVADRLGHDQSYWVLPTISTKHGPFVEDLQKTCDYYKEYFKKG